MAEVKDLVFMPLEDIDETSWLDCQSIGGEACIIARITHRHSGYGLSQARSKPGVHTAVIHMVRYGGHDMWCDQDHMPLPAQDCGAMSLYDRNHDWKSRLECPFDCMLFHFPQTAFEHVTGRRCFWEIDLCGEPARFGLKDAVMHYLSMALLPVLFHVKEVNQLFVEHIFHAVIAHLVKTYGLCHDKPWPDGGHLAAWQLRRSKELIMSHLDGRISVDELAAACRLSPSHFTHLFKKTMGTTPHQWLIEQRVAHAKHLLRTSNESLIDIAYAAGFADQSHFSRVFSQRVKMSPSVWRRQYKGPTVSSSRPCSDFPLSLDDAARAKEELDGC